MYVHESCTFQGVSGPPFRLWTANSFSPCIFFIVFCWRFAAGFVVSPSRHQNSGARYSSWNLDEIQWMNGHSDHRMKLKFETVWFNMIQFHLNVFCSLKTEFHVISIFKHKFSKVCNFSARMMRKTPVITNQLMHQTGICCTMRHKRWFAHQQKQHVRHGETTLE